MEIKITDKARKHLEKIDKKDIVIELHERCCWGGNITKTVVVAAVRDYLNSRNYQLIEVDDYKVYLDQKLFVKKEGIVIDLDPFMFIKQLKQSGVSVYEV